MTTVEETPVGPIETLWRGARTGQAVVFLHHGFGTAESMRPLMDVFSRHRPDLSLLSYSRPGCGRSPARAAHKSPDYLEYEALHVLPAILRATDLSPVHLVGHSDGGSIALIAAAQGALDIRSVTAIAPHSFIEDRTIAGVRAVAKYRDDPAFMAALARRHDDVEAAFGSWLDIWLAPEMQSWSICDLLGQIRCPVGIIQGTEDDFGTGAQLDVVAKALPQSRVRTRLIGGAGHDVYKEQPAAIFEFWQEVGRLPRL
ncbi:alpha/beta fold hydrolase [Pseudohoeflea coraliihabitans]|uniref:Alpha/beta hydrolase n=1 Tax=Pseudohoeflea coraliihabitans TaxID=2860393 RepID=A0ABS6WNJ7_9HYPH|nr:alpha/beta hydrolase [Pseudohoeflea sp. DP4N28-3]